MLTPIYWIILHAICIIPAYLAQRMFHKLLRDCTLEEYDAKSNQWTKRRQTKAIFFAVAGAWAILWLYFMIFCVACIAYAAFFIYMLIKLIISVGKLLFSDKVSSSTIEWDKEVSW